MKNIDRIREAFKSFEKSWDNKKGISYLESGLSESCDILESAENEENITFVKNLIPCIRNSVTEKAKGVLNKGTPDCVELELMMDLMLPFKRYGFDDEPDFKDTHAKIVAEWCDVACISINGRRLPDAMKVELYNQNNK